jgi:putative hydrolase
VSDMSTAPRDPITDLRRIAFLLERSLAPTPRVRAFRTAAAVIADLDPADLTRRAAVGSLTDLAGIGATTSTVIAESLAGRLPDYLAKLESTADESFVDSRSGEDVASVEARDLLAALRGDCHSHSDWSDGGSPILEMAQTAQWMGHEYLALTDHSPRLTVARGLTAERLRDQLGVLNDVRPQVAPMRLLSGIEVDILDDGALDQSDELLGSLDVVVASVHSKLRMDSSSMTPRMVAAIANPHTDILGHLTGRLVVGRSRPESDFDAELIFAACAQFGVAVEINSRPERLDPPMRLLEQAIAAGCIFSIDTDAHAPGQLEWRMFGCARAVAAGVPRESIVNTWPVDDLLAWTSDHSYRPSSAG